MTEQGNLFLIGPMGSGKSTIGRQLSQKLNMQFFDSDQEIERRTGADISWIFDIEGEISFRNREEKIINELTQRKGIVLATGGGSIISQNTRNHLSSRGKVIYLNTTIEKQLDRTKKDKKRPLLQINISPYDMLKKLSYERDPLYKEIADITIRTDKNSIKMIVNQIVNLLGNN